MEVRYELDLEDVERMYPLIMSLLAAPHSSLRSMVAELGICLHEPLDQVPNVGLFGPLDMTENILTYRRTHILMHTSSCLTIYLLA
jgi:hypothetical protein